MNISNMNDYLFQQRKALLDSMLPQKRAGARTGRVKVNDLGPAARAPVIRDEVVLSVNARVQSSLPREQQYLRDENGNIRMIQIELAQRRIQQRDYMNDAVAGALRENGIEIVAGENFEISVDSSYRFNVSGENAGKAEQIANALNAARVDPNDGMAKAWNTTSLGRLMFAHIKNSTNDVPVQVTKNQLKKYQIDSALRQWTGLSLADLRFEDDAILTPDRRDVFEVIGEKVSAEYSGSLMSQTLLNEAAATVSYIKDGLTELQKIGLANIKDAVFKIELGADGLSDIGLANGFGVSQRGWYDTLLSYRDKNDPNPVASYWASLNNGAEPNAWKGNV
ncbi:MAG: DUF4885 domain-containing protein [Peptococcaceae bacterium]|jgi:hypothetical protein|nr:DUF4885 domain-containing protein [Peptococcaceae bacterium]